MDRLEAMSILVAAVDAGSLSAASRRLGVPLATVSRKVSELEAYLGTRLVNRSRRLTVTEAGHSYVAACKRILDDVGEAERAASGEYRAPQGDLIITAPIVFGRLHVLPIVSEFLKAFSEIDVRLFLSDRVVNLFEDPDPPSRANWRPARQQLGRDPRWRNPPRGLRESRTISPRAAYRRTPMSSPHMTASPSRR